MRVLIITSKFAVL